MLDRRTDARHTWSLIFRRITNDRAGRALLNRYIGYYLLFYVTRTQKPHSFCITAVCFVSRLERRMKGRVILLLHFIQHQLIFCANQRTLFAIIHC